MSEQTTEQKLQSEIIMLKARILDVQDVATRNQQTADAFNGALGQIATALGLEGESITVESIVDAVKALTAESADEE
jgi:hypothetical protein